MDRTAATALETTGAENVANMVQPPAAEGAGQEVESDSENHEERAGNEKSKF